METAKETPKEVVKETPKEVIKPAPKGEAKKYLVIKNFTLDKQYYKGNEFVSSDAKLVERLFNSKLIK